MNALLCCAAICATSKAGPWQLRTIRTARVRKMRPYLKRSWAPKPGWLRPREHTGSADRKFRGKIKSKRRTNLLRVLCVLWCETVRHWALIREADGWG